MHMNQNEIAARCLDAAANLDDDESASPTELCQIAQTIATALFPTDSDAIRSIIHNLIAPADNHDLADCADSDD